MGLAAGIPERGLSRLSSGDRILMRISHSMDDLIHPSQLSRQMVPSPLQKPRRTIGVLLSGACSLQQACHRRTPLPQQGQGLRRRQGIEE